MKLSSILGLNARTQLFSYRFNTRKGKKVADSKIQTWRVLKKAGVPCTFRVSFGEDISGACGQLAGK